MTSLCKQIELPQLGLDAFNLADEIWVGSAGSVGYDGDPSMNIVRHDCDRPVRRRNPVLRTELLEDQKYQFVCGRAFSSHTGSIAEAVALANHEGVQ